MMLSGCALPGREARREAGHEPERKAGREAVREIGSRSAPEATPLTWRGAPGPRFVLVIDPGHGGSDAGTRAENGLLEKELTLNIARRVRSILEPEDDLDVVLTRDGDQSLTRVERVAAVRRASADLMVSLHFNGLPQRHLNLVETYYAHASNIVDSRERRRERHRRNSARDARLPTSRTALVEPRDISFTRGSERFAKLLQANVHTALASVAKPTVDGGVKRDTLFILTQSFTSGALIEMACLSHAPEADRLLSDDHRERLADAVANAVRSYREVLLALSDTPS